MIPNLFAHLEHRNTELCAHLTCMYQNTQLISSTHTLKKLQHSNTKKHSTKHYW